MIKIRFKICLLLIVSMYVTACASDKVIVTQDQSADYKSAVMRQPLKKKDFSLESSAPNVSASAVETQGEEAVEEAISAPAVATYQVQTKSKIETREGATRLQISSDLDGAWSFILEKLKDANTTVYSRLEAQYRVEIGCGDMATQSTADSKKKSKWAIFKERSPQVLSEHCGLVLVDGSNGVFAKLIDKTGVEIESNYAKEFFESLL